MHTLSHLDSSQVRCGRTVSSSMSASTSGAGALSSAGASASPRAKGKAPARGAEAGQLDEDEALSSGSEREARDLDDMSADDHAEDHDQDAQLAYAAARGELEDSEEVSDDDEGERGEGDDGGEGDEYDERHYPGGDDGANVSPSRRAVGWPGMPSRSSARAALAAGGSRRRSGRGGQVPQGRKGAGLPPGATSSMRPPPLQQRGSGWDAMQGGEYPEARMLHAELRNRYKVVLGDIFQDGFVQYRPTTA